MLFINVCVCVCVCVLNFYFAYLSLRHRTIFYIGTLLILMACVCVCVGACVRACVRACVLVQVWVCAFGCCFGSANGLLVDVCQCCCLLMFVCLPLSRHFPCKTWWIKNPNLKCCVWRKCQKDTQTHYCKNMWSGPSPHLSFSWLSQRSSPFYIHHQWHP